MARSFDELDHVICRMNSQGVLGKTRPWRDAGSYFTHMIELPIGGFSEQRDHDVFQSDYTHAQVHQFDVAQRGHLGLFVAENQAAFIFPSRECPLALL